MSKLAQDTRTFWLASSLYKVGWKGSTEVGGKGCVVREVNTREILDALEVPINANSPRLRAQALNLSAKVWNRAKEVVNDH